MNSTPKVLSASLWRSRVRSLATHYVTDPLVTALVRTKVNPNVLTVAGFLGSVAAGVALGYGWFLAGGAMVLVASFFDMLDGALARRSQKTSKLGAFLDSNLDRLSEAAIFGGLLVYFADQQQELELALVLFGLVASFMVSYVRARAEGLGLACEVGVLTRPERIIILGIGLLADQVTTTLWIVMVLGAVTTAQRFIYVWRRGQEKR